MSLRVKHRGLAVMLLAVTVAELCPLERLTLIALGRYADAQGQTFVSQRRLSRATGYSDRTLRTALRRLAARGLIVVEPRAYQSCRITLQVRQLRTLLVHAPTPARISGPPEILSVPPENISAPPGKDFRLSASLSAFLSANLSAVEQSESDDLTIPRTAESADRNGHAPARVGDDPALRRLLQRNAELRRAKGYGPP